MAFDASVVVGRELHFLMTKPSGVASMYIDSHFARLVWCAGTRQTQSDDLQVLISILGHKRLLRTCWLFQKRPQLHLKCLSWGHFERFSSVFFCRGLHYASIDKFYFGSLFECWLKTCLVRTVAELSFCTLQLLISSLYPQVGRLSSAQKRSYEFLSWTSTTIVDLKQCRRFQTQVLWFRTTNIAAKLESAYFPSVWEFYYQAKADQTKMVVFLREPSRSDRSLPL